MSREDLQEMLKAGSGSDFEQRLATQAIDRVAPEDRKAFDALGGLVSFKGAGAVPDILDKAAKVADGPIRFEHVHSAISHTYPTEAWRIMQQAMR